MKKLADYWQHKYDWRAEEKKLNRFDQFTADIDGMNIQHWSEIPRGGHFGAMEEPELLAKDMFAFFSSIQT